MKKYNKIKLQKNIFDEDVSTDVNILPQEVNFNDLNDYSNIINKLKYLTKNADGTYNIDGKIYNSIYGSRKDVWDFKAYQTTGKLLRRDLILAKNGNIVSRKKSIQETLTFRFKKNELSKQPDL